MDICEFAGCGNPVRVSVPTLERPSRISRDHPDYHPPQTTLRACSEHAAFAISRAAALESEVMNGPFPER
jgi:hypothetical protein